MTDPINLLVVCNDCGFQLTHEAAEQGEASAVTGAWNPAFDPGMDDGDVNLLMCPTPDEVPAIVPVMARATRTKCEKCGVDIWVARSSNWLLEAAGRSDG